jgi:hypothetical protein
MYLGEKWRFSYSVHHHPIRSHGMVLFELCTLCPQDGGQLHGVLRSLIEMQLILKPGVFAVHDV